MLSGAALWLTGSGPTGGSSGGGNSNFRMQNLKQRISAVKNRAISGGDSRGKHYVFSGRVRTRDAGSERVDWQFVGFPSASAASAASAANEPSFTLESASRRREREEEFVRGHYKRSSLHEQQLNYDEPYGGGMLRRANSVEPPPPPVPPRAAAASAADGTGPRRPPPRPHSLYAQVLPKPNGFPGDYVVGPPPPPPPPHQHCQYRRLSQAPHSPPPIPPHSHSSGVPHALPLSPPANVLRRPARQQQQQPSRPKSFYDSPEHCQQQLRYFEQPPLPPSSPFYQRVSGNRHSFAAAAAFDDGDPTPTNSPPPRPPPKKDSADPTAVPLLPRRYNSGFSPIEDRLKEEEDECEATYDELWGAGREKFRELEIVEGRNSGRQKRNRKSNNRRKQKPRRQSRPPASAAAAADTTEEEKYSSPVRTKGRLGGTKTGEAAAAAVKECDIPGELHSGGTEHIEGEEDAGAAAEASESMEIVLHISEDGGDKTDVEEEGNEILFDGKIRPSLLCVKSGVDNFSPP